MKSCKKGTRNTCINIHTCSESINGFSSSVLAFFYFVFYLFFILKGDKLDSCCVGVKTTFREVCLVVIRQYLFLALRINCCK